LPPLDLFYFIHNIIGVKFQSLRKESSDSGAGLSRQELYRSIKGLIKLVNTPHSRWTMKGHQRVGLSCSAERQPRREEINAGVFKGFIRGAGAGALRPI
jgi:hypothetical protein